MFLLGWYTTFYLINISGNRLAVCLESIPEESPPTLLLSSTTPISFKQIEVRRFPFSPEKVSYLSSLSPSVDTEPAQAI
jgi:hypothetical protein